MAKSRYTKSDLSRAASEVKRQIINKISRSEITRATKVAAFEHVSTLLKLKSARTLWEGDTFRYLDQWYNKLENEIKSIHDAKNSQANSIESSLVSCDSLEYVLESIKSKNSLLKEYEKALKVLREENEALRIKVIEKHGKIDI